MEDILQKAELQLQNKLPFVIYRQPDSSVIQAFFMKDSAVLSTDFQQEGFCFFPFDNSKQNYFFPLEHSVYLQRTLSEIKLKQIESKSKIVIEENEDEKRRYIQLLSETIHHLKQQDFQKIVLSRPIQLTLEELQALHVFEKLILEYPSAMVYCWYHPNEGLWLGATPETLVKYSSSQLKTMALAGTRLHQPGIEPNWRTKEREEQELVSQYIQQKLKKYSQNVIASKTHNKQAGNLVHLNTNISARIKSSDLKKVILDLHPTPAICGLPTEKARTYILQNETYDRSFYAGFMGEINMPKETNRTTSRRNQETLAIKQRRAETNLYVNLRCMKITDKQCQIYVGGGITSSSNATEEWQETRHKSETLLKVL